ncbi:MAG: HAD-IB family hydrolase [Nitrosomonadales bacterium]|nr:HAD-IB family hydrolase [Nitrosomonadales bacterium]
MSEAGTHKPSVAAFDFDGTLTRRDTLLPFLRYLFGDAQVARQALLLSPTLVRYGLGLLDNGSAKERVFVRCLAGMGMDELERAGERFAALVLPGLLRQEALQRLEWHKQQGHRCVAISASLELYVRPWAIKAGFDDVLATRLEMQPDDRVTGKLSGANCYGAEKVRRLEALLGSRSGYTLYAYGDSRGDRELLSYADHAWYRKMPG